MNARGFTLIEILVVMTIISIVLSLAILSIPNLGKKPAEQAIASFQKDWLKARDQARLGGYTVGLVTGSSGYRFIRIDAEGSRPLDDDNTTLKQQEGLSYQLQVDGSNMVLNALHRDSKAQVLLLPHGETTPFTLSIQEVETSEAPQVLKINFLGLPEHSSEQENADDE